MLENFTLILCRIYFCEYLRFTDTFDFGVKFFLILRHNKDKLYGELDERFSNIFQRYLVHFSEQGSRNDRKLKNLSREMGENS